MPQRSYTQRRVARQVRRTETRRGSEAEPSGSNYGLMMVTFMLPAIVIGIALVIWVLASALHL